MFITRFVLILVAILVVVFVIVLYFYTDFSITMRSKSSSGELPIQFNSDYYKISSIP